MRFLRLLVLAPALFCLAMGEKPPAITVRFFAEANARDGSAFSTPYKMKNPPRDVYLQKVPAIHEKHIAGMYPFRADDGTWGCAFKLNNSGRIGLEVVSTDHRGSALVGFVGTARGTHPAVEMIIDRTVSDGIISIPRGLTDMEMGALAKEYKVLGGEQPPNHKPQKQGWFAKKEKPEASS